MNKKYPLLLILLWGLCSPMNGSITPNALFSDNAVLQRETPIPVWGSASNGEKVTVRLDDQEAVATAIDGKWRVVLPAHKEGGPFVMTISGENTITATNVMIGEVWVCAGQSNMEFHLGTKSFGGDADRETEVPSAEHPGLRMFNVERETGASPKEEVSGKWMVCSPSTVDAFSAVGYYFGRDILKATGVPVGMIHSSWGGTAAETWTSFSGLEKSAELKVYKDSFTAAISDYIKRLEEYRTVLNEFHEKVTRNRVTLPADPEIPWTGPTSPLDVTGSWPKVPTVLYNGMIAPLIPYAFRGVIWYQGEGNNGQSKLYQKLFPAMIADWREKWGRGDFPFLFVQIAPWKGMSPEIREAQFMTLWKSTNTAMIVTTDYGDANDIHPKKKQPIGARLALAARALAYGEKIEYSGPLFESLKIDGNKCMLTFTHVGSGLIAKGGPVKGFTIAGSDGHFVAAKAEIEGGTVVVSAETVSLPSAVRYGWATVPDGNLFNKEGLPASPFRTDVQ